MAERYARPTPDARQQALQAWLGHHGDEQVDWSSLLPGPPVAQLAARLSAVPRSFLDESVDLLALGGDVLGEPEHGWLDPAVSAAVTLIQTEGVPESTPGAALGLWIYASVDLLGPLQPALRTDAAERVLAGLALRLAPVVPPYDWLVQAERREEAARGLLLWSGQRPAGEDVTVAQARWEGLDSLRRDAALRATLTDYVHRQDVLRRLQADRAREAAARYTTE